MKLKTIIDCSNIPWIYILYFLSIFITLFISAYIFICVHFTNNNKIYKGIYTNWHFPMLLALMLDLIYENPYLHY